MLFISPRLKSRGYLVSINKKYYLELLLKTVLNVFFGGKFNYSF